MDDTTDEVVKLPHWFSVAQYAAASGIQTRTVYLRIRRGVIVNTRVDGMVVIDTSVSVPIRVLPRKMAKAPPLVWPTHLPPRDRLIQMRQFCERNNIRGHAIYTDILFGKLKAYLFAETVFLEDAPELKSYVKHRRKSWQM